MRAFGEPGRQALAGLSRRLGGGNPAGVEAKRAGLGPQGR
jgi:hypothetical protein